MIYVLVKNGNFLFLDIDTEYFEKYDTWYFNKKSILLNIGWQLEQNITFNNKYADYDYRARKYESSYQVIKCIEGFGINDLNEMKKETLKYIFESKSIIEFI